MSPDKVRRALFRLLDSFARSSGDTARTHARLIVALLTECPWLVRQVSPEVLSRAFDASGYLRSTEGRKAA